MEKREYYVLDRVEEGQALLLPLDGENRPAELPETHAVRLPVRALRAGLPAGQARPADGMLFYRAADGSWQADPAAAAARQAALRQRVLRLLGRGRAQKG